MHCVLFTTTIETSGFLTQIKLTNVNYNRCFDVHLFYNVHVCTGRQCISQVATGRVIMQLHLTAKNCYSVSCAWCEYRPDPLPVVEPQMLSASSLPSSQSSNPSHFDIDKIHSRPSPHCNSRARHVMSI